jgi:TRAP-type C4-dicarboxylate transport system substrate-binding protein
MILISALCVTAIASATGKSEATSGEQKTYLFKYANTQTETHPRSKSMMLFKDQLEKASSGRIKVELYFSGTLGGEAEVLDMVATGTVQGCRGGLFERANKKYLIYTLPFMFENTDQVIKLMRSDFGDKINQDSLKNGFYIPACGVAGGFRNITSNIAPITKPEDLKGLRMRTPPIDMTLRTFKALGANPQQVAYTETYMALKSGVLCPGKSHSVRARRIRRVTRHIDGAFLTLYHPHARSRGLRFRITRE